MTIQKVVEKIKNNSANKNIYWFLCFLLCVIAYRYYQNTYFLIKARGILIISDLFLLLDLILRKNLKVNKDWNILTIVFSILLIGCLLIPMDFVGLFAFVLSVILKFDLDSWKISFQ